MKQCDSSSFFEISSAFQLNNSFCGRMLCLKDFLRKCLLLPFTLVNKAFKTIFRVLGLVFGVAYVLMTFGSSSSSREYFMNRVAALAKDLADWLLLPFAIVTCFFRLLLAFVVHPNFYFNAPF